MDKNTEMPKLPYRDMHFMVLVQKNPDAEVISLIANIMDSYPDANHKAIAEWFSNATFPKY